MEQKIDLNPEKWILEHRVNVEMADSVNRMMRFIPLNAISPEVVKINGDLFVLFQTLIEICKKEAELGDTIPEPEFSC